MVLKQIRVNWNKRALTQLEEACNYIKQDSIKSAIKVKNDIFKATDSLAFHPEKHPLDKYKKNNDGSYRAFTLHHYRISYKVLPSEVKILRLRHSSMEPLEH